MKCNSQLRPNYFSRSISVLAVVFRRQISENLQFCLKLIIMLIRAAQVLFYVFSEKDPDVNVAEDPLMHLPAKFCLGLKTKRLTIFNGTSRLQKEPIRDSY